MIQIDEEKMHAHLEEVVRSTVEETLNALLNAEADRLCQGERYERTETHKDTRAVVLASGSCTSRPAKSPRRYNYFLFLPAPPSRKFSINSCSSIGAKAASTSSPR